MPNVLITNQGLDFISSAHDNGVYIDLRYFIPVYDDRIDPNVRNSLVLSSFSDIADKTITEPYGEKLWRRNHTLGDASTFLISAVEFNTSKLTNTYQKSSVKTNLYDGTPLSDQVSATSWSATGGPSLWTWEATAGGQGIEGDDSQPGTGADGLGFTNGYYPTYDTSAEERLRGSFKYKIDESWGNIKFNKIAMYAVAVDADGNDITSIGYFGEAYLSTVAIRSNIGIGYDLFEIDVQIDLSGVSGTWNELFYSSSADYWSHSPGGLYYPGRIGVGIFEDGQKEISATMHVRRERTSGTIDDDIPQIRIDQTNSKYWTIEVLSDQYGVKDGINTGGDMVLGIPDCTLFKGNALAIRPSIDGSIALGTENYSFRELWLYNYNETVSGTSLDDVTPLNVTNIAKNYAANFNANEVRIGKSDGTYGNDKFALRINDLGVDITSGSNQYGSFKGGDIVKDSQNLLIYNTFYNDSGEDVGVENIYLIAGIDLSSTYSVVDGQSGATHKNILYAIENEELISDGSNENLANEAELHIAAKGKIGLHGPIEIQNLSEYADTESRFNAIVISRENERQMMIGAGILDDVSYNVITNRMGNLLDMSDLLDTGSRLYLIAKNINVNGNIIPLVNNSNDIGSIGRRFSTGYFNEGIFNYAESLSGFGERDRNYPLGEWVYGDETDVYSNALISSKLVDLYSGEDSIGIDDGDTIRIDVTYLSGLVSATIDVDSDTTIEDLIDKINSISGVEAYFQAGRIVFYVTQDNFGKVISIEYFNNGDPIIEFNGGSLLFESTRYSDVLQVLLSVDKAFTKVGKTAFVRGSFVASATGTTPINVELPSELKRKIFTDNLGYFQGSVFPELSLGNTNLFVIYPVSESDSNLLEIKPTDGNYFTGSNKYYYSVSYECFS